MKTGMRVGMKIRMKIRMNRMLGSRLLCYEGWLEEVCFEEGCLGKDLG